VLDTSSEFEVKHTGATPEKKNTKTYKTNFEGAYISP